LDVAVQPAAARAKAVIGWNPRTNEVVSGQFDLPDGYEHWLLKFDLGRDAVLSNTAGFGRIEYAHYLMALEAGIEMSESRLLEEGGRAHFMTKRFDRRGNDKVHVQSLCGLMHLDFNAPYVHGYEQYLRAVLELKLVRPRSSKRGFAVYSMSPPSTAMITPRTSHSCWIKPGIGTSLPLCEHVLCTRERCPNSRFDPA